MADLPHSAPVVVVGAGVMGTSTLHHLVRAGCEAPVMIERDTIAAGSTSKAAGGFRAQFSDALNIRIALRSIAALERFGEDPGYEIDFKQWGYLFLLREGEVPGFEAAIALQNGLGVPSRLLTPEEAGAMVPGIRTDDLAAAAFCGMDGYATPEAVAAGYARAAADGGGRIVQGCEVLRIVVDGGRVTGVETTQGTVATDTVVLAAGVWGVELAAGVGLGLPVRREQRHVWFTGPDPLVRELPLTIDFATSFYFHREGDRLLFGGREQTLDDLAPHAVNRLPLIEGLGVRPGWWGWYGMSPDHNAIVGAAADPEGLLYACGFSGHGFQQGPVMGEYLAALALGLDPPLDLTALSVDRFASGALRPEGAVV